MKKSAYIFAIIGLFSGILPLPAQETQQPEAASVQAVQHPFYEGGFYPAWSRLTPGQAVEDVRAAMAVAEARIEAICNIQPGEENYDNVFNALDNVDEDLRRTIIALGHLSKVKDSAAIRRVQQELIPVLVEFSERMSGNERLWQVVKRAAEQPWVKELPPAKQRCVRQTVDMFIESGINLAPEKRARKAEIITELAQLERQYDMHLSDSAHIPFTIYDRSLLDGLGDAWLDANASYEGDTAQWTFSMDTSYALMARCTNETMRKQCWERVRSVATCTQFNNEPIIARIMELRQELAEIMGYANYADMETKDRMMKTGAQALAFVDGMMQKIQPAYRKECQELLDYVSECTGKKVEAINPWDINYYEHKLARERYNSDPNTLRPYLRSDKVIKAMFDLAGQLYGITITEVPTTTPRLGKTPLSEGKEEVWNAWVKLYKVTDNKTGAHLGSFYLDPYRRYGKEDGAWTLVLHCGHPAEGGKPREPHLVAMVTDLPRPDTRPYSLISPTDVETLFHEFGHVLHAVFSDAEVYSHMGTDTAMDFVELPSKMNEYWLWEPEVIATYAIHYQTGEPMPQELVQQFIASRYHTTATDTMEQLLLAKLDLEMHMHYKEKFAGKPLDDVSYALVSPWRIPVTVPESSPLREFPHSVTGSYSAGYYSYAWAEVLAADAFTRFRQEGIFSPLTAEDFRRTILSQGDSKPADEMFRDFMGRDPDPDALMDQQGKGE